MPNNESNSAKSNNGAQLNKQVNLILTNALKDGKILDFKKEPRYNQPGYCYGNGQFSPDFEITLSNQQIILIDNTTSARHDRFKQKQWDANGCKNFFNSKNIDIKYFIVLPFKDNLSETEFHNFENERKKIIGGSYYSVVDNILLLDELLYLIDNPDSF